MTPERRPGIVALLISASFLLILQPTPPTVSLLRKGLGLRGIIEEAACKVRGKEQMFNKCYARMYVCMYVFI